MNPVHRAASASRIVLVACILAFVGLSGSAIGQQKKSLATAQELPTGMSITPTAARGSTFQPLNPDLPDLPQFTVDHPISTAVSPDGNTLLILTSGYNRNNDVKAKAIPSQTSEYVFVFDLRGAAPVKQQVLRVPNTYVGLAWAPDGRQFYVSGGQDDNVHIFAQESGRWAESSPPVSLGHKTGLGIAERMESKISPLHPMAAGVAVSPDGKFLLVANYQNDSVSLVDLDKRLVIAELDLRPGKINPAQKGVPGGEYPYGIVFAGNEKAYVSSLRDREIVVLTLKPALAIASRIKTHGQPGKLIVNRAGTLLFAAADNSDSVVIADTAKDKIAAEIKTTAPASLLANPTRFKGSNPNSMALSPDEKTLYVTNGGTNSVAVVALDKDPDDSRVVGLVPTGWYPTSVSVSRSGAMLYVVNGKSMPGPNPEACRKTFTTNADDRPCAATGQYILQLEKGGFAVIPRPDAGELRELTQQVARNNHFSAPVEGPKGRQLFSFLRQHIKHVIYIVKENRSYDQVLGDLEKGNGDPSLTLFPEAITPNHHDLARRFVTLDNFYDSGEVSGVGWNWSTAARTTDEVERTIPIYYAARGLTYDVEGLNRNINVGLDSPHDRNTEKLDDAENQLPGHADVAAPDGPDDESGAGYLWDAALRSGLTVRNYGFFIDLSHYSIIPKSDPPIPLLHDPAASGTSVATATKANLQQVTDPYFRGFDQRFADYWRFKEWEREFDAYVAHDNLPSLELVRLEHDHLGLFDEAVDGVNTVETQIADNDYAVGLLVEKVAHSKFARDTLIFVIEDDAQNGPDHVDAHRSLAFIAGPYVKQRAVISKRFNTVTMLRTMEEVLGIKPLGLNDALQPPMAEVFSTKQAAWTYKARVPSILRTTKLPLVAPMAAETPVVEPIHDAAYWTEKTRNFDFTAEDKLDSESFNIVLWKGLKGESQPYPSERDGRNLRKHRAALLRDGNKSKAPEAPHGMN
ncbi:MAG TPA: beta-propeller fold lactonase family protein [Candidatus Angelobacter sp.]|nr:beta-propeller fold lactonase family protein [Candidatus Angelobacter sp.]